MYMLTKNDQSEMTAEPEKYPQKWFNDKSCRNCGVVFPPKAPSHLYCSQDCADRAKTDAYLMRNYGIDFGGYLKMLKEQGGRCKVCGGEGFRMKECHTIKLVVDHCHATGKVRGLLCHNCNRALGLFRDNTATLVSACQYLEGATTIPEGSTSQAIGDGSAQPD